VNVLVVNVGWTTVGWSGVLLLLSLVWHAGSASTPESSAANETRDARAGTKNSTLKALYVDDSCTLAHATRASCRRYIRGGCALPDAAQARCGDQAEETARAILSTPDGFCLTHQT
jgi:hypothetical protein